MILTLPQLRSIMPNAGVRAIAYLDALNKAAARWEINTPARLAAWLAQLAHESGELRYVRELASGAAYDTGPKAKALGNTPAADGDGQLYKGRGLIQITGRNNYRACSLALFGDYRLLTQPQALETVEGACQSAGWFWSSHGLNALADQGAFEAITRRINGGTNGADERRAYWVRAKKALGV